MLRRRLHDQPHRPLPHLRRRTNPTCHDPIPSQAGASTKPRAVHPTLIGHNDIAPYNACFDGDELVGVFDWDLAGPTNPLMELAFIAWNCVPLWRDIGDEPTLERLRLICATYGAVSPVDLVDAVPVRIQTMLDWIPRAAAAGDEGMRRLLALGEPARSQRSLDDLVPRLARLRSTL